MTLLLIIHLITRTGNMVSCMTSQMTSYVTHLHVLVSYMSHPSELIISNPIGLGHCFITKATLAVIFLCFSLLEYLRT